jgi:hypothetical protein
MRIAGLVLLVVSLVPLGCRSRDKSLPEIDPSLVRLVPGDTVFLAGARMSAIRATPLYRKWTSGKGAAHFDRFAKETGFDPRKDLAELLVASDGKNTLFLAKGNFSVSSLESKLEQPGASKVPYKGYTILGSEQSAVVFLDTGTAVAGPAPALRAMIDQRGRGDGIPPALAAAMKPIPDESQAWAVMLGAPPLLAKVIPDDGNLANLQRVLASVESATLGIDLREGLRGEATGAYRTKEDAKFIHDALRGLVGMGRLTTPDNEPDLLRFYDGITIQQRENTVHVLADIPMDVLDKFLARMQNLRTAD